MSLLKKLLLCLLVLGGGRVAAQPAAPTVVRGRVLHPNDSVAFLAWPRSLLDPTPVVKKVRLSPQGEFQFVLDSLPRPVAVQWGLGRPARVRHYTDLWLTPGDTLTLTADARHFNQTLRFAGPGAALSYYRAAQRRARTNNFYDAPEGRSDPNDPARMRARANRYRQRAEAVLRDADRAHPLPPAWRRQEAATIRYQWGQALLGFPYSYEYRQWAQGSVVRRLPDAYYDFLAELPLPQDSLLAHPAYREFARSYATYLLRERRQQLTFAAFLPQQFPWAYDTVRQVLPAGPTRNYVLAQVLDDLLRAGRWSDFGARRSDLQTFGADADLRAALDWRVAHLAEFGAGQPAPEFAMTDLAGHAVRWADLRGKVVYLDVWASWCQPCRAEAPALRALQAQFAGRAGQVVFLSFSIDSSATAWRRAVAADHLAEAANQVQALGLLADPALGRLWAQRGVPQYWLIGPDGLIIDANAPRPSNPAATAALETALKALADKKPVP